MGRLLNPRGVLAATAIAAGLLWLGHHLTHGGTR